MRARPEKPARPVRLSLGRLALAVSALVLVLGGCGGAGGLTRSHPRALLTGRRGPVLADLAGAVGLARRFARVYAADAYRRRPPGIREESAAVRRALADAAGRVPRSRRGLRPRLLGLRLRLGGDLGVVAAASIGDGRFPPFSVGFTVSPHGGSWLVTSISPPD
ncbi:MAG: hypothetical protein JST59_19945 [Actinobacteria bacterium]|nr:hypothetical protein [Actinomycetota bacterium]